MSTNPLAELRTAYTAIRERAYIACAGPWRDDNGQITGNGTKVATVQFAAGHNSGAHIAAWSPDVALEVAEWLERVHDRVAKNYHEPDAWPDDTNHAMAVAHAYNQTA